MPDEGNVARRPRRRQRQNDLPENVTRDDFFMHSPDHRYIYRATGQTWPASSVDERLGLIDDMKASKWISRNQPVEQMTWYPGEDEIIEGRLALNGGWIDHPGSRVYNTYRRPPEPKLVGSPKPWLDHLMMVYPDDWQHLLCWFAHRVQHPDQKINHCIILGGAPGIGKDTLLEPVKRAIGAWNWSEIQPTSMSERFNGYLKSVVLRISEARDLGDVNRYAFYEHTKILMAAPPNTLRVNEKNMHEYEVANVVGVVITTNHKTDGLYLPADDRRHYVAWSRCQQEDFDEAYWRDLWEWYTDAGFDYVARYLYTYNIAAAGWSPTTPPPKTSAFWDIVAAGTSPEEAEIADALDVMGNPDAFIVSQLRIAASEDLRDWLKERKNSRAVPHRIERAGYVPVRNTDAKDGRWKIGGKRQVAYAKQELTIRDQIVAVRRMGMMLSVGGPTDP